MHVGIAGEVRFVVRNTDGTIKTDTGFQRNILLDQGLDFLGGEQGTSMFAYCLIGSGNSAPRATQNTLDSYLAKQTGTHTNGKIDYDKSRDSDLYKTSKTYKYRFADLGDVNITEVGLASKFKSSVDYYLCTRALIKDSSGSPMAISVKADETLDVYYKIHKVTNVSDATHTVTMTKGDVTESYHVTVRPFLVGKTSGELANLAIGVPITTDSYSFYNRPTARDAELVPITNEPNVGNWQDGASIAWDAYVSGEYARKLTINAGITALNVSGGIRMITIANGSGMWQIRYGSVADDSPIPKTAKDILTLPLECSWGRYEGDL